jgi:hypothetical protein
MNKTMTKLAVMATVSLLATAAIAQDKPPTSSSGLQAIADAMGVREKLTVVAVVQAVDYQHRLITLKGEDGKIFTVKAGDEVHNLAQIKPGAIVKATYSEAVALQLDKFKSGDLNVSKETVSIGRAALGQLPAGDVREDVEMVGTILAINPEKHTVKVQGPERIVTLKVPADWNLKDLKVGDEVQARYVQELAVGVSAAPPASYKPPTIGRE